MDYNFFELLSKAYGVVESQGYSKGETAEYIKREYDNLPDNVDNKYINDFLNWLEDRIQASDYFKALGVLRISKVVPENKINLLLSALNIYFKNQKEQRERDLNPSTFQGEVGDYITFEVAEMKAISYNHYGSYYGGTDTTYWRIVGTDKNIYMWSTATEFEVGDTIGGKVKAHKDFRGEKQTIITRGKVISTLNK